jgi:hypothetical protein
VTKDGVLVGMASIPWTNGTISINIDNLPVGSYEYNITVYDGVGNFIEDSVIVTVVDTTLPFVDNPSNRNYELGTPGNAINWTLGDVNPDVYHVTRNGVLIETKSWINGTISVNVDNLPVGIYEFNITVYDEVGNFIVDSVNVTVVDSTPPSVSGPSSFNYEFGTTGNKIEWNVGDIDPSNYNVTVDNVLFGHQANLWTNGTISINVDGFDLGSYELNLTVFDVSGNFNSQTVSLTIIDTTAPLINDVNDIQYYEGSTGNEIVWNIDEIKGDMYIVYKDNEIIMTNAYTNSTSVIVDIDGFSVGQYNFTLFVNDTSGNFALDTVIVNVLLLDNTSSLSSSTTTSISDSTFENPFITPFAGFFTVILSLFSSSVLIHLVARRNKRN